MEKDRKQFNSTSLAIFLNSNWQRSRSSGVDAENAVVHPEAASVNPSDT
jgi:hypothetical protein